MPYAEDVERHVVAVRQLIASLVASTMSDSTAKRFIREASEAVGMYLVSGENVPTVRSLNLAIVPSEIVRCLRESGILARYNISEPETISPTFDVQAWVPTDEVIEVEGYQNLTSHGWAEVVRAADRSRAIDEHLAEDKREAAANDNTGENT